MKCNSSVLAKADILQWIRCLFLLEALAVGTLVHGGMGFVGSHLNLIQRAEVGALAVVSAGFDSTTDAMIGMFHIGYPPFLVFERISHQERSGHPQYALFSACYTTRNRSILQLAAAQRLQICIHKAFQIAIHYSVDVTVF